MFIIRAAETNEEPTSKEDSDKRFARDPMRAAGMAATGVASQAEIALERTRKTDAQLALIGSSVAVELRVEPAASLLSATGIKKRYAIINVL